MEEKDCKKSNKKSDKKSHKKSQHRHHCHKHSNKIVKCDTFADDDKNINNSTNLSFSPTQSFQYIIKIVGETPTDRSVGQVIPLPADIDFICDSLSIYVPCDGKSYSVEEDRFVKKPGYLNYSMYVGSPFNVPNYNNVYNLRSVSK